MVSTIPHPSGATGKHPLVPGTNATLSLILPLHNTSAAPSQMAGNLDLMKTLVDTITWSNARVKKLNLLRKQCLLDTSSSHPILDNEDKSPILDLSTFMSIPVTFAQNPMLPDVPCIQNSVTPTDASGPNSIMISACPSDPPHPIWTITPLVSHEIWQSIASGITDQAHAPEQSPAKSVVVAYQSLGPIYSSDDLSKNKQLDMMDIPNPILQMAYNKIYILLSMLTHPPLAKFTAMTFEILKNSFQQWLWEAIT